MNRASQDHSSRSLFTCPADVVIFCRIITTREKLGGHCDMFLQNEALGLMHNGHAADGLSACAAPT
jgi:hypothetical protein